MRWTSGWIRYRATEAAAQLLDYNYRLLGSWPLALTAYNHGAAGMRRARDAMGTSDIAVIARKYRSPSFGFASRNFYVSFLAALEIDRNPDKYFSNLKRQAPLRTSEVEMPAYVPVSAAAAATEGGPIPAGGAESGAASAGVGRATRWCRMATGCACRRSAGTWTTAQLAERLDPMDQYLGQPRPRSYKVQVRGHD